jgi:hypothetical protein
MHTRNEWKTWPVLLGSASALGAAIAAVDNLACGGEISPLVIVALLAVTAAAAGLAAGGRGAVAALFAGAWLPGVHIVKKVLGVPDTLQPDSYGSIAKLAALVVVVAAVGATVGVGSRKTFNAR